MVERHVLEYACIDSRKDEAYPDSIVASEVKQGVLEHTTVASGENEAVTVEIVGVLGVVPHDLIVQDVTHGSTSHGEPRVTRISLLDGVNRQESDRVDRLLNEGSVSLLQSLDSSRSPDN